MQKRVHNSVKMQVYFFFSGRLLNVNLFDGGNLERSCSGHTYLQWVLYQKQKWRVGSFERRKCHQDVRCETFTERSFLRVFKWGVIGQIGLKD